MKAPPSYFLKLGLATALAYLFCTALGSKYPFYAVISVIVVLQPTLGTTTQASLRRVGGTIVGILLGGLLASLRAPTALGLGAGVGATVFICTRAGLREGVAVSAFALTSIVLNHPQEPWLFAWHRFLDTMVGIVTAVAINRLLWPPRAGRHLKALLVAYFEGLAHFLEALVQVYLGQAPYDPRAIETLRQPLRALPIEGPTLWAEARNEAHAEWADEGSEFVIKRLREHLLAVDQAVSESTDDPLPRPCEAELGQLASQCIRALRGLAGTAPLPPVGELEEAAGALQTAARQLTQPGLMRFFTVAYNLGTTATKLAHLERAAQSPRSAQRTMG